MTSADAVPMATSARVTSQPAEPFTYRLTTSLTGLYCGLRTSAAAIAAQATARAAIVPRRVRSGRAASRIDFMRSSCSVLGSTRRTLGRRAARDRRPRAVTCTYVTRVPRTPDGVRARAWRGAGAKAAIAFALAQLGKPYVWGGTGPRGYDYSGLVMRAWERAGVKLPRTTWSQVKAGKATTRAELVPGDLVISNRSRHVQL
ncbi:C40 family peptidase [Streptomyces scopuliridis]|uniref:C40 family peptidase n=1 Tax=Streptomyces scopuliridis TaxID=452529 RepID=UPI0034354FBD